MGKGDLYTQEPEVDNLSILTSDGKISLGVRYDAESGQNIIQRHIWMDDKRFTDGRRGQWTCFESVTLKPDELIMVYHHIQPLAFIYDCDLARKEAKEDRKIADNMRDYWKHLGVAD